MDFRLIHIQRQSSYRQECVLSLSFPTLHTHTQKYTHSVSMLQAQGSDLSKGFLLRPVCQTVWRAVEGLASPGLLDEKASNIYFLWPSNNTHPSHHLIFSLLLGRIICKSSGRLIPTCSSVPQYPPYKALSDDLLQ